MIYNFGAEAISLDYVVWNDTTHYDFNIYIINVTDTIIDNLDVQVYDVYNICNLIDYSYSRDITVFEGIGALNTHLLYYSDYDCNFELMDNLETTAFILRYYSVNSEMIYTSAPGIDCDVLTRAVTPVLPDPQLSIFPNPAQNFFYVNLNEYGNNRDHQRIKLILYQANGRKIAEHFPDHFPALLNVSPYPAGIYYLQIVEGDRFFGKSLIIGR